MTRRSPLATRLADHIERYRVPGAALAILAEGEIFETAAGVLNVETGVEVTTDSVFQIGSITKLFTATLVMQLVDEGRLELDTPIRRWLPELELSDPEAARRVTLRQLLSHTSGIDGDHFVDTGRGAEAVERFVVACAALPQLHPPGRGFSYCNAGFVLAGRIVEKLRGAPFDSVLREWLSGPIGAGSLHTLAEFALYYRAALGHLPDPVDGAPRPAPIPGLPASNAPAGATPFGAARDLIALAQLHLAGGLAADGTRVVSEASVMAMRETQVELHPGAIADAWGLGWMLFDWGGTRILGHDGTTIGQASSLRVSPEHGVAVAVLVNGGNSAALVRRVHDEILGELIGCTATPLPEPQPIDLDLEHYVGSYERLAVCHQVTLRDEGLWLRSENRHMPVAGPPTDALLRPISEQLFEWRQPGSGFRNHAAFLFTEGASRPAFLHIGGRSAPRQG